tara:strand:+ start:521 stop:1594 length:1074 start_codon:yes stop_codon:yes gene_type:complete
MHSKEHIKWLEENNLLSIAKNNSHHFERVLKNCMKLSNEKLLIVGDQGFSQRNVAALMAAGYYVAAKNLGIETNLIIQQVKNTNDSADKSVVEALESLPEKNAIALCLSNKLGSIKELSLSYRNFVRVREHKFVSTTSIGSLNTQHFPYMMNAIDVNYEEMAKRGNHIKEILSAGSEVNVKTALGTDINFDISGKDAIANIGDYYNFGHGGNIPAGETYIPPNGKNGVNGKFVIDASLRHKNGTSLPKHPVTIHVENGDVIDYEGQEEAQWLKETIEQAKERAKRPDNVGKVCELGIGINPNAKLIGSTIIDEKVLGTCHIAIGSNKWFGGDIKTIVHLDQVMNNPEIYVDGKLLKY